MKKTKKDFDRIQAGQIYEIIDDSFFTTGEASVISSSPKRPVNLLKGEKIEIRYPYEWHFRTIDNKYYHCEPEMIEKHCKPYGIIWENVRFGNSCKLEEILRLNLFTKIKHLSN